MGALVPEKEETIELREHHLLLGTCQALLRHLALSVESADAACQAQVANPEGHLLHSLDAWVIALLLSRAGLYMHAYPQALFAVREWELALGFEPCLPTRVPEQRRAEYGALTAALFTDAAQTLHGQQIGVFGRCAPWASLRSHCRPDQRHERPTSGHVSGRLQRASSSTLVWCIIY